MKCCSCLIYHWYLLLSAALHQSSALAGPRCPSHGVWICCLLPFPKGLLARLVPFPAQRWEQSEIRRAQGRGKQPLESCYQMPEISKPSRYVYTVTCLARFELQPVELCRMWVVTHPQLQGQGSCRWSHPCTSSNFS